MYSYVFFSNKPFMLALLDLVRGPNG
jgi:hypothetical protein